MATSHVLVTFLTSIERLVKTVIHVNNHLDMFISGLDKIAVH